MDKKPEIKMRSFGLIGKDISYSFSKSYFSKKFKSEGIIDADYQNFDLKSIENFMELIASSPKLVGLNVTIPYKEQIIPYLDSLDKKAEKIGAVNTIKFLKKEKLKGYNTDYYGFKKSIKPLLKKHHKKALILGTGGASKAIAYVLKRLEIDFKYVSRSKNKNILTYDELDKELIEKHTIIVNCTPLGTFPNTEQCPDIPYNAITANHLLFDLIYNPAETKFLKLGKKQGAVICNGLKMLELQAEKSWKIWND